MSLPPFPSDLPVAPLLKLSLAELSAGDATERGQLLRASIEQGFFLLDLRETSKGQRLLNDVDEAFKIGQRFFAEDAETKMAFKVNAGNVG